MSRLGKKLMILKEFSQYLKKYSTDGTPSSKLLARWLKYKLSKKPKSDVEKILHAEIGFEKNKNSEIVFVGKLIHGVSSCSLGWKSWMNSLISMARRRSNM